MSEPEEIKAKISGDILRYFREDTKRLDIPAAQMLRKIFNEYYANKYEVLDTACDALSAIGNHYECTWGREGKTPDIKKIGQTIEDVNERCSSCKITIDIVNRLKKAEKALAEPLQIEYYICSSGGQSRKDGTEFYCPTQGRWYTIEICQKRGCNSLKLNSITVTKK